jgi:hypothetical protein
MHLVVNHSPIEPATALLTREASAARAHRAVQRLCLLWPQYHGILLACVEIVGPELRAPAKRRSVLRRFLLAVREAVLCGIADYEVREETEAALHARCAETAALRVSVHQEEWDMLAVPYRVWRRDYEGALAVTVRAEGRRATAVRAQALYQRLSSSTTPRRARHGRR